MTDSGGDRACLIFFLRELACTPLQKDAVLITICSQITINKYV